MRRRRLRFVNVNPRIFKESAGAAIVSRNKTFQPRFLFIMSQTCPRPHERKTAEAFR